MRRRSQSSETTAISLQPLTGRIALEERVMKVAIAVISLLAMTTLANANRPAQAAPAYQRAYCTVRVLYSEELPFAPIGTWLVKATFEITPPNGNAYQTAVQEWMPWQGPPPRRGQGFRVPCDRADPRNLYLIPRSTARAAF
jgi:hypothetical protein